jgi:hypothetical protein
MPDTTIHPKPEDRVAHAHPEDPPQRGESLPASHEEAIRQIEAANLAVQDANAALKAAIAVQQHAVNAAAEVRVRENRERAEKQQQHNQEVHQTALDKAHAAARAREKDVPVRDEKQHLPIATSIPVPVENRVELPVETRPVV